MEIVEKGQKRNLGTNVSVLYKSGKLYHPPCSFVSNYLKFTFNTAIVTTTDRVTSIMVNSRYLPKRGTVRDVGGMISASSRKNTVNDSRILIHSEIFSPESLGK